MGVINQQASLGEAIVEFSSGNCVRNSGSYGIDGWFISGELI